MTDKAVKKDTIKKHVRALLLSSPVALTVNELKRDFHSFIGEALDHRSMGYTTIEDFFRDIDDAVHIGWKNGIMTLTANADETTKHIEKLVSKQKVNNKKKYAVLRSRSGHHGGLPQRYQGEAPRFQRFRGALPLPSPAVPAFTRNQIKEMFKSFPNGLPVTHFMTAFSKLFGTRLNFANYGFFNLQQLLQSDCMKDVVGLHDKGNGEMWISPEGMTRNSWTHGINRERNYNATRSDNRNCRTAEDSKTTGSCDNSYSYTSTWNSTKDGGNADKSSNNLLNASSETKRPSKGRGRRRESSGDSEIGHDARSVGSSSSVESPEYKEESKDRLEIEIQQVLEKRPAGIWARRLPGEYTELHGKLLDFREYGYLSVIDFISSLPSTVRIERPSPQGDWMLYDARIPKTEVKDNVPLCQRHSSGRSIEAETKEVIQKILHSHPTGIAVKDFSAIYKLYTGSDLPISELGFDGPEGLFISLADSILQIAYSGNGGLMLFSVDVELPDMETSPIDSTRDLQHFPDYPEDVVGPGCHYAPVMCPEVEQYVELYVSNIINPGLFWVILRHKTKSLALETLMDNIDASYNSSISANYKMPDAAIVPGQVCATLFPEDNNWHRGVITGTNDVGFIEVYYVDYGNTTFVQRSTLRFLKSEFLTLPAQAIQGRLANIHPPTGKWKVKSRNRMLELTREKPLVAYVTGVQSQVMSVCLTDTSDPQLDLHINDVLLKEGHAKFQPDDQNQETLFNAQQHSEVPDYCHVFGWTTKEAPRLPHILTGIEAPDKDQSADCESRCYIKWVQLTKDHVIHLINLDRVAYVVSTEISSLMWEEDILTSMLKQKKVNNVTKLVVSSDEYPQLFQDLTKYNVKSLKVDLLGKGQFLSLYALNCVPVILQVFQNENHQLISAIQELTIKFDPDSPYWKSCELKSSKASEDIDEEESNIQLSREGKQMALQALKFKRKRILQLLMNDPASAEKTVNDLNNCEVEIMMIKQELQEYKQENTCSQTCQTEIYKRSVELPASGSNQSAENHRAIQNIMASTTKPIATANIMTKASTSTSSIRNPLNVTNSYQSTSGNNSFMPQSTTGSFPGMMGVNHFLLAQAQSDAIMANAGMSAMVGANISLGAGMGANFNMGLLPQLNPLLAQQLQQNKSLADTDASVVPNQMGDNMLTLGRGQPLQWNNLGILPGLLPLLQNMNLGRGRGAPGPNQ